jgi:hypothetical protein
LLGFIFLRWHFIPFLLFLFFTFTGISGQIDYLISCLLRGRLSRIVLSLVWRGSWISWYWVLRCFVREGWIVFCGGLPGCLCCLGRWGFAWVWWNLGRRRLRCLLLLGRRRDCLCCRSISHWIRCQLVWSLCCLRCWWWEHQRVFRYP